MPFPNHTHSTHAGTDTIRGSTPVAEAGIGIGNGTGAGIGNGTGAGIGIGNETGAEIGNEIGAEIGNGTGAGIGIGNRTGVGIGIGNEIGAGIGIGNEAGVGIGNGTEAGIGTGAGNGNGTREAGTERGDITPGVIAPADQDPVPGAETSSIPVGKGHDPLPLPAAQRGMELCPGRSPILILVTGVEGPGQAPTPGAGVPVQVPVQAPVPGPVPVHHPHHLLLSRKLMSQQKLSRPVVLYLGHHWLL